MEIKINSLSEIGKSAKTFVEKMGNHKLFAFYGKMGTGKTTFIKETLEHHEFGDDGRTLLLICENGEVQYLAFETPVSMNFWGFTPDYFEHSEQCFVEFLKENINKPKAEFFIPTLVNDLVNNGTARVKVLTTESKWFGVTYAADRQGVVDKFAELHATGVYPDKMF